MKEPSDGAPDGFIAARAHFATAAEAARGAIKGELAIYPREPGDHYDRTALAALRTGDLFAFRATGDRRTVLTGFAAPDGIAVPTPGLIDALRKGKAIAQDEPGLARLFAAAKLGTDEAMSYADVLQRLKFLFHDAVVDRLCPLRADGDAVQVRWSLSVGEGAPAKGITRTRTTWLTARYDRAAGTVRLTSGDEGC
ncbi:MAG: hypothetical protein KC620_18020 [Myxococcales bacterium]|nr:hypothetical protein [Myxococcales bacterium]